MSDLPKILWVDDDPYILSSIKRLLIQKGLNVLTVENPMDVISILEKTPISVVVSDQRMPQMTGLELLKEVRNRFPHVTRLMVTAFSDKELLEEAINEAGVFRFITKPWNESELISDIQQALEYSIQIQHRQNLNTEIKKQNEILQQFTENLEQIILDRTKEINQFNREQEIKNKKIRELVVFIQDIHKIDDLTDLMDYFLRDLRTKFAVLNLVLCFKSADGGLKILSSNKGDWVERVAFRDWTSKVEIKINDKQDQQYLVDCLKRPVHKIVCLPFIKSKNTENVQNVLYVEHDINDQEIDVFIDYITSRLQILSLAIGRILFMQKIDSDSKYWEQTFDSINDPLCILDRAGKILKSNMRFQENIKQVTDLELNILEGTLQSKTTQTGLLSYGNENYNVVCFPILEDLKNANHFVVYYRDITDERNIYEKMIQNEKMAALGLLAGNVAHELNNPLTGIRSTAQILKNDKTLKKEFLSDLDEIDKAASRCQGIIQSFKEFSGSTRQTLRTVNVDINDLIHKTLPFLKTSLRQHNLNLKLSDKKIAVTADPQFLQQIIFNIVINACQALDKPGIIELRTSVKGVSGVVEVEDNGVGISKSIQKRIFEPFFTTKSDGEGTGLGLSFCKSAIEKMNGEISFDSVPGKGTVFKIKLGLAKPAKRTLK